MFPEGFGGKYGKCPRVGETCLVPVGFFGAFGCSLGRRNMVKSSVPHDVGTISSMHSYIVA